MIILDTGNLFINSKQVATHTTYAILTWPLILITATWLNKYYTARAKMQIPHRVHHPRLVSPEMLAVKYGQFAVTSP